MPQLLSKEMINLFRELGRGFRKLLLNSVSRMLIFSSPPTQANISTLMKKVIEIVFCLINKDQTLQVQIKAH